MAGRLDQFVRDVSASVLLMFSCYDYEQAEFQIKMNKHDSLTAKYYWEEKWSYVFLPCTRHLNFYSRNIRSNYRLDIFQRRNALPIFPNYICFILLTKIVDVMPHNTL